MTNFGRGLVVGALTVGAFSAGLLCRPGGGVLSARPDPASSLVISSDPGPQGRGSGPPIGGGKTGPGTPGGTAKPLPEPEQPAPLVYDSGSGQSGAAGGFIAVTGAYGVGTSVLYVLDTKSRQLAVYEARGGSAGTRRLTLVGARRIDLDLQLEGYNDDSEFSYRKLLERFQRRGRAGGEGGTGPGASERKSSSATTRK